MLGYVTLGTNDMDAALDFYDPLFAIVGDTRVIDSAGFVAYGSNIERPMIAVVKPFNGEPATAGNGTMVGLAAETKEKVAEVHAKALELGGQDEGAVGPRGEGFYAGYFRDLDGNKLVVFLNQ